MHDVEMVGTCPPPTTIGGTVTWGGDPIVTTVDGGATPVLYPAAARKLHAWEEKGAGEYA